LRSGHAGVGPDQEIFQLLPELFVDAAPVEEAGDVAEPTPLGALQRRLGALLVLLSEPFCGGWLPGRTCDYGRLSGVLPRL
jgi:hypothetical protein